MLDLTSGERKARDAILAAMAAVQSIDGEELFTNQTELAIAVHGLQRFVSHHVLTRLMPHEYQAWYRKADLTSKSSPT